MKKSFFEKVTELFGSGGDDMQAEGTSHARRRGPQLLTLSKPDLSQIDVGMNWFENNQFSFSPAYGSVKAIVIGRVQNAILGWLPEEQLVKELPETTEEVLYEDYYMRLIKRLPQRSDFVATSFYLKEMNNALQKVRHNLFVGWYWVYNPEGENWVYNPFKNVKDHPKEALLRYIIEAQVK